MSFVRSHQAASIAIGLFIFLNQKALASDSELQPVIQKVQFVFSIVSHHLSIAERVQFYDTQAKPRGNTNYVVPHLVCDPLVTLYNPHPVSLHFEKNFPGLYLSNPPVGFRFEKNGTPLRYEPEGKRFLGVAQMNVESEFHSSDVKRFSLTFSGASDQGLPGASLDLQPGETKVFSPWIEDDWTWRSEISEDFYPYCFFDGYPSYLLTRVDVRTRNLMGVECLAYSSGDLLWDPRAGFQWDWLSQSGRPAASLYSFEKNTIYVGIGAVAMQLNHTITVQAKAMRTQLESADIFDLRVTQREGVNRDPGRDGVRYFTFDADAIKSDVSLEEDGIISRTFRVGDLLQTADDRSPGGKTPFAVFSLKIRRSSLVRGSYLSDTEEHSYVDGDRYFDSLFTPVSTFEEVAAIAEKPLPISEAPQVLESAITPDGVFSVAIASAEGLEGWRVVGGTSPESWTDDLTEQTTIVPLPTPAGGAAIHRVSFQSTGRGPNYFIRLEKPEN